MKFTLLLTLLALFDRSTYARTMSCFDAQNTVRGSVTVDDAPQIEMTQQTDCLVWSGCYAGDDCTCLQYKETSEHYSYSRHIDVDVNLLGKQFQQSQLLLHTTGTSTSYPPPPNVMVLFGHSVFKSTDASKVEWYFRITQSSNWNSQVLIQAHPFAERETNPKCTWSESESCSWETLTCRI